MAAILVMLEFGAGCGTVELGAGRGRWRRRALAAVVAVDDEFGQASCLVVVRSK